MLPNYYLYIYSFAQFNHKKPPPKKNKNKKIIKKFVSTRVNEQIYPPMTSSPPVVNVKAHAAEGRSESSVRATPEKGKKNMDGVRAREAPRAAAVTRGDRRGGVLIG